jgi:proteasome lid subunit RPN8/RPN11
LRHITLTDEVSRLLFEEYTAHRESERGDEEFGWMLLGTRSGDTATVLATLPAGAERDAGHAHVWVAGAVQQVASRAVRQAERKLTCVGVVHTHPGSLRHPSSGDYRGDIQWVRNLRGHEGIFGIGTADGRKPAGPAVMHQPQPHVQLWGELRFSWYALAQGDRNYRPLPLELTLGPDLARSWRPVWPQLEQHADALERLARQQQNLTFGVVEGDILTITLPLAEPGHRVQVLIGSDWVQYVVDQAGTLLTPDLAEPHVAKGVYQLLAELAVGLER